VIQPLLVQATLFLGLGLLAEAALSFLGLGVQPPTASWGSMLQEAYQYTSQAPGSIYPPGIAIGLTVVAFNSLGDAMRDAFDLRPAPRWRRIRVRKPTPMTESETT
jgi:peptide/nickel transport system permease protein